MSPGKREITVVWLLLARNQSKLHRATVTQLWNSSSLPDNDEADNTKELFYVYSLTQSLFRYDIQESFKEHINPYPTAFPYGNGMVLHFYQQQESSTTKTVHKVINRGLKAYV